MTTVKEIADEIVALQSRKNADYGNAFGISMQEFGLTAPAIRLTDKLNRFKSLIKKEAEVKSESIEDTLIDLAAYAMMTVAEMRNGEVVSEKICKEIIENAGLKVDSDNRLKAGDEVELIGNDIIGANTGKIYALKGAVGDVVCVEGDDVYVNFRESHWQVQLKTEQVRKIKPDDESNGKKDISDNHLNCGDKVILKENIVGREGLDIKRGEEGEVVGKFETSGLLYVSFKNGWVCAVKPDVLEKI